MLPIALVLAPIALIVVPLLTDLVEPKRVERFARRQGLVLMPSNGDRVLTYLRVTRRWRSLGLLFGLLVLLAGFTAESITVRPLPPFLGWFAGALTAWELFAVDEGPDDPRSSMMALQAATFAGKQGPLPRPAPFALSGDGFHAVYLHARTRRMVHQDLRTGVRHDLTGPLADAELPVPVLSHDGRRVALTAAGPGTGTTLLVDADGGRSAEVPGIARVLGVGPRGFTAVTVPEGDKVELITVSPDGAVRTRVPFDPGPSAGLFPDGRRVLVLTEGGEAVTVDPATGKTIRRVKIRAEFSEFGDTPELLGWDARGRFLARLDLDDADDEPRLVDPATGKTSEAEGISLNESHRFPVLGKVDPW